MNHSVLNRLRWLAMLLVLLLGAAGAARASHLLGGDISYRYLDATGPTASPLRYEITVTAYINCGPNSGSIGPQSPTYIGIYSQANGAKLNLTTTNYANVSSGVMAVPSQVALGSIPCNTVPVPTGCTNSGATRQPYQTVKYVAIVNLPRAAAGYYALWTDVVGGRNYGITNINSTASTNTGLNLFTSLAPATYTNHSPVFSNEGIQLVCVGDTTTLLNNAVDADGDRLEYSFVVPSGQPRITSAANFPSAYATPPVLYNPGYSATAPLGASPNYAAINANTGVTKLFATALGQYTVAIDVKEYRQVNGIDVLIGTTRRDIQLVTGTCSPTPPPIIPSPTAGTPRTYTIEAGSTLTVPLTATQASGHDLDLTATSVLLDGTGGYNATFANDPGTPTFPGSPVGTVKVSGTGGTVSGTLVFTPGCNDARPLSYDVNLTLEDKGCAGKTVVDLLRIFVTKPSGPTAIAGNLAVCGLNTTQSYTASGGTAPNVSWRLSGGGTFVGSSTTNPVQVNWPTAGTFTLTARGVSQYGCPTDSVQTTIVVSPAATLTVTGNQTICLGSSTTLTVTGSAPYTITGGPTTQTGAGPFTLSPTQTTTYTITGAATGAGCAPSTQVTVTVNPPPTANAGPAASTCSGVPVTIGTAPVAGYTYSWSPATGLSSPTAANPTVTLPNSTGAPITQTYTLTVTGGANCTSTATVTVTVNPLPVANPGPAVTFCSGNSAQLGAAPVAGLTYNWSPTTGLSSPTAANPTVTLTNPTGASTTQTYTLTVTNATTTCTNSGTVAVTVNPLPTANAGPAASACSGAPVTIGAAPVAGYTYSWSPTTGLSSATAANPTVTLTNTTGAPTTQTYTLTVTNAGCTSTATVAVTVSPQPVANAGAAVAFCSGSPAQLGAAPVAGLTYNWSPTTGLSSPTAANPTVTLTNTTNAPVTQTYTLTVTNAGGCTATNPVLVTVNPQPVANAGAAVAICSGSPAQLGAAPVAGYTYSWSPTTGLSSPTAANPTVTLTNTTNAPVTQTYTLTVTSAGCTSMATVAVTVNPQPVANAGAAVTFCSGSSAQLGATAMTGYTYSWSPTTGLSSATAANPTVTLTNTTGAPVTQTYTLTVTNAGCTSTGTVAVTVNPSPVANVGTNVVFCSGGSATLGGAAVTGYTYSWSPTMGLSSAMAANPTITLTNTTNAPVTQTYTLTVTTTATGCTATSAVTATVNPLPVANAGTAQTICSGGSATLGAAAVTGYTYNWSPTMGVSSATAANPVVTLTNTTGAPVTQTYTLTVTGVGNCMSTGTVAVIVNPQPVANAGVAVAFCSGGSAQLGAAPVMGLTYSWLPTTGLSSATVANPTVTLTNTTGATTTQTYTLTVTNPTTSCTSTGTVGVTVNPLPVATAGPAVAICSGASAQLGTASVTGNTYSWSPATSLSSATAATPTITLTNTTGSPVTQTYTLTVTNATGCVSTSTVVVTVNPLPTAVPGAAIAFCSGDNGQLGAASVTGLTYSWSPATGLSSATVSNPTVTLTNTTTAPVTQTYTLTVTNATGCTSTGTVVVTVNPLPTAVPGAAVAFCSGGSAQLGAAAVTGNTYSWSPATGLSSATVANPTVTLTNTTGVPVTQTYTLTMTNATNCVSTATVVVTVNPLSVAVPGAAVAICSGSSAQLGAAPITGLTYSWSPATGLSSATAANPTVTLTNTTTAATTQTYTLTVTNATGCTSTGTVAVTVTPLPVATAGAATTICSGNTTQLGGAPLAGLTYSWSPTTGLSNSAIANPALTLTNVNPTGVPINPTYTLTVTNPTTGCVNTSTVVVTVNAEILPGIIGPNQTVCASSTPVLLTSTPGPSGGYGTYTYQWESSTDNLTWTTVPGATSVTYAPGPLATTIYYRRRVNSGSCAEQVTNSVKLELQPQLTSSVTLATPATQCAGTSLIFTPVPANAGPAPTFRWYVNNTLVATSPTYTSSTLVNGDVVRVEVVPTAGFCAASMAVASVTVNLTPVMLPTVRIKAQTSLPACSSTAVNFVVDSLGSPVAGLTYQWQINGVSVSGATSPTFTSSTLQNGQVVTLVLTAPSACGTLTATSNPVPVVIIQNVDVDAGPNKTIMEGDQVELEGTASGSFPVTWTPSQTLSFPGNNPLRPMASPTVTTTYTLSAQVGNCSDESKVTITVTPRVRIPNAFSPNGDGLDDTWEIDRVAEYPNNHVIVFNRWGNKLFETTNYGRGNEWNGTINGQPAPLGTYYYLITLGNGKSYSGPLTVIY